MIDLQRTRMDYHSEKLVGTALTISDEGSCLVDLIQDGVQKVAMSNGVSTEILVGFASTTNITPVRESVVEEILSAGATIQLKFGNITSLATDDELIGVRRLDTGEALVQAAAAPGDGQFSVAEATGVVTLHADEQATTLVVTYMRDLTAAEAVERFYEGHTNNETHLTFGQVGVIQGSSVVFTDMFDPASDYAGVTQNDTLLTAGAASAGAGDAVDGMVSIGGTGGVNFGMMVVSVPTIDIPFLGIAYTTP